MAWVRFKVPPERRTLETVYAMLSWAPEKRDDFAAEVRKTPRFAGGLTLLAVERQAQVGKEEGGSNFTTVANQFAFLNYPELLAHTATSSFDPLDLADGNTDLFVVAPEETIEHVKGWIRLWIAIPNAVAGMRALERDLLIVIDEMPRLGYLKPVMDGYTMAAGKGVHFWCFAQSISALDSTWGKEHRKTLLHLAELVQVLGFPRTDAEGAGRTLQGHRHRHLRGQDREPLGHYRREPHRHRQHPMAGRGFPRACARAPGHTRRAHDAGPRPAIRDRHAQGHAARCAPPSSRALLAPPRCRPSRRSKPIRAAQAARRRGRGRRRQSPVANSIGTTFWKENNMTEHDTPAESDSASPAAQAALPFGDTADSGESPPADAPMLAELLATVRHFAKRTDETRSQEYGRMGADIATISQNVAALSERTEEMRSLLERPRVEGAGGKAAVGSGEAFGSADRDIHRRL